VAFRPTFPDGLALSIESILAEWEDMSKEKPDRAISSKKLKLRFPDYPIVLAFSFFLI
jgi:hypothetical protein